MIFDHEIKMIKMETSIILHMGQEELRSMMQDVVKQALFSNKPEKFDGDERLTRKEICNLYKVSLPTVHACMKTGLPYEKCGRKTLFRRSDVDRFFASRKGGQK